MLKPGLQYDGFGMGNGISQQDAAMAAVALHNQNPVGLSAENQQQQEQQRLIAELVSCSPLVVNATKVLLQMLCRFQLVQISNDFNRQHQQHVFACIRQR